MSLFIVVTAVSLDNLLVSFMVFLDVDYSSECGLQFKKICNQTSAKMIGGIDRDEGIFVKTMFGLK